MFSSTLNYEAPSMTDPKAPTHIAYGRIQFGRRFGPWLEIGVGRPESGIGAGAKVFALVECGAKSDIVRSFKTQAWRSH